MKHFPEVPPTCHTHVKVISALTLLFELIALVNLSLTPPCAFLICVIMSSVMQSLGSSEWPSQASLSSTTHLVFSESDQTEDDSSEVLSEEDVEAGLGKSSLEPCTRDLPQSPHSVCGDQQGSIAESDRTGNCHKTPACAELTSVSATRHPTEGDLAFSRKVSHKN